MSFSRQFLLNIFSSWYSHAIRVLIAFFFIPFITSALGDSRYGVWVIIFQAINYFTLLDLGLNAAIVRFVSRFLGERNFDKINRVLCTSTLFYLGIGIIAAALIVIFSLNYFDIFKIENAAHAREGATAMAILGILVGIRFILMPFGGSVVAFHRQDINNMLNICEDLIRTIVIVILLFFQYGLVEMALAVLIINTSRQLISLAILKHLYPQIQFSFKLADRATLKSLLQYSKIAFGISAAWMLIFNSDSLLLGLVSSSVAAGIFNPAIQVMFHLRLLVSSISIPLTPAVSHLEVTADIATIGRMYLRSLKYVSYLIFMICTGVAIYADPFVGLWLPLEFAPAALPMKILAISGAFYLPQILGNSVLLGLDKHRYLLIVLILEVTVKIILALLLIKPFGLIGMAVATAVPQLILYTFLYPNYVAKVLGMTFSQIMRPVLISGLTAVTVTTVTAFILHQWISPWTWKYLILNVSIILFINLIPAHFLIEKKDLDKLRMALTKK